MSCAQWHGFVLWPNVLLASHGIENINISFVALVYMCTYIIAKCIYKSFWYDFVDKHVVVFLFAQQYIFAKVSSFEKSANISQVVVIFEQCIFWFMAVFQSASSGQKDGMTKNIQTSKCQNVYALLVSVELHGLNIKFHCTKFATMRER